jgi:DNA-binding protein HU-beta
MNKGELIQVIADKTGQTKVATEKTLNTLLETVVDTVAQGQEVALLGFGTAVSRTKCNSGSIGCGYLPFGLRQQVVVNL